MRMTYGRGIIRLVTSIAVFMTGWMLKDYCTLPAVLLVIIAGYATYHVLSGFIELD
ncbi:MAG: hypothetical protein KAS75_01770 [Planctomycetes bacterium]|nr:hypothetical protein [Planctomycetota bacterium]